ncbi:MAG: hypothetical protein AB4426_03025 [Xenococcaceae cyanobacterium]
MLRSHRSLKLNAPSQIKSLKLSLGKQLRDERATDTIESNEAHLAVGGGRNDNHSLGEER